MCLGSPSGEPTDHSKIVFLESLTSPGLSRRAHNRVFEVVCRISLHLEAGGQKQRMKRWREGGRKP